MFQVTIGSATGAFIPSSYYLASTPDNANAMGRIQQVARAEVEHMTEVGTVENSPITVLVDIAQAYLQINGDDGVLEPEAKQRIENALARIGLTV